MRSGLAFAAFAVCATGVPAGVFALLDATGIREVEVGLDVVDAIEPGLAALRAGADDEAWDIAYLGDSMIVSYAPARRVPARLQLELDRLAGEPGRFRVHSVAAPGMGPFDYYLLADRIAAAGHEARQENHGPGGVSRRWRARGGSDLGAAPNGRGRFASVRGPPRPGGRGAAP